MTDKSLRVSPRFLLLSLILAYSVAPIVSRAISSTVTTYAYMLAVLWALFVIVLGRSMRSLNTYVSVLLPFLLFQALTYFTRSDSLVYWGYSVLLFLLPVAVAFYVINERPQYLSGLSKWLIVLLAVTLVTTLIGLIRYPFASRVLATAISKDSETVILYNWNNIGGYQFIYTLVLLYPLLILAHKQKRLPLLYTVMISLSIGVVIIFSEYTIALLLFLLSSVLFLFRRQLSVKELVVFSVCGVIAVAVFSSTFSDMLMWLADQFDSEVLRERLVSLAGGTTGLESSESQRIHLYRASINTFLSNPLFGTMFRGGTGSGSHSQIFDTLAVYGLLGAGLLVWMYRYIYALFIKPFKKEAGFGYVIWFLVQAIFLSAINTGFWFEVLALYGPLILSLIYGRKYDENGSLIREMNEDSQ